MKKTIIAIDGYSACGKSTLAKQVASRLKLLYVDTGAMYRAVTLYFLNKKVDLKNSKEVELRLSEIEIDFDNFSDHNRCLLNSKDVEDEIRLQKVSSNVSQVATLTKVRRKLVAIQRELGNRRSLVMDGRDIGTVVFPNATLKIFLTADKIIRAERRYQEYLNKGIMVEKQEIINNLEQRDHMDSNRKDSPLKIANDAIIIDNSFLSKNEQLHLVLKLTEIQKTK